jgi:hypothetical protein
MAGVEAACEITGAKAPPGDEDDEYQIGLMMEDLVGGDSEKWERLESRLRKMTRMLVRRHRARIERVADALLQHKTLSNEQLNELVGRSIDDVRVNVPELKQMYAEMYAQAASI